MKKVFAIIRILPIFHLIFLILIILVLLVLFSSGCANMVPPSGGARDSLPPVLEKVDPPDSSKNFSDKTITFTFDEYLDQIQNATENLLFSPTPNIEPFPDVKLKTVILRLKDTLEPNTTYYINFGNAIRDINEGNVLRDFTYIFTTGQVIDTLELTGKVILAETGKIDSTLIVMLHRSGEDSAVMKEIPRYITKLDGRGNFRFRFLPPGTYYIYALKDEGRTRKYFAKTQLFAFADKPVEIKPATEPVTLYAFAERKDQQLVPGLTINRPGGNRPDDRRLKFSHNLNNNQQDLLGNFVLTFEQPLNFFDSSKVSVSMDSSFRPVTPISWKLDTAKKKLSLQVNWIENTLYNIIFDKDFAEDTLKRKLLKTDTIRFKTKRQNEYGQLKIRFRNLDLSKNPVLLFIQGEQVMKSFPLKSENFIQNFFLPGDYELRILYDENGNGIWDTGNFFENRKQPELVKPVERRITVRMNWNNEMEIAL